MMKMGARRIVQTCRAGGSRYSAFGADGMLRQDSCRAAAARPPSAGFMGKLLPEGYPSAVRPGYMAYSAWGGLGAACSSAAGVLSTQTLLYAVGLQAGVIPLSAALTWVIKDGLGQVGGIIFSSVVSTRFDRHPKLWRMVSALAMDAATALELVAPILPGLFVPLAGLANVGKNISCLSASASRAAIHTAFARSNNIADITAKSGSQTMVASTGGMGAGILLSASVGSDLSLLIPSALALCGGHILSTYLSLKPLVLPALDEQRLLLVTRHGAASPSDIARRESVVAHYGRSLLAGRPRLVIGGRVEDCVRDQEEFASLLEYAASHGDRYLLVARRAGSGASVTVLLMRDCPERSAIDAAHHAARVYERLTRSGFGRLAEGPRGDLDVGLVAECRPAKGISEELERLGWCMDTGHLESCSGSRLEVLGADPAAPRN